MRLLALYLLLPASVLFAAPLTLRSRLQSGAPMTVEAEAKEGVYLVTVVYGGDDIDSATTMKAELRRVYEIGLRVPKGGAVKRTSPSLFGTLAGRRPRDAASAGQRAALQTSLLNTL